MAACRILEGAIFSDNHRFVSCLFMHCNGGVLDFGGCNFHRESSIFACLLTHCNGGVSNFGGCSFENCQPSSTYLAKRGFSMILDSVLHLFWSASLSVDGDFSASS